MRPTRAITPWLFLAPGLAVFGAAVLLPMALTAGYSFTEWNGFGPMTFVGLDNYARALDDSLFRSSFLHVLIYIAATLVLEVAVGLGLAGLVDACAAAGSGSAWRSSRRSCCRWSSSRSSGRSSTTRTSASSTARSRRSGSSSSSASGSGTPATALLAISVVSGWVYAGFYMIIFYAAFRQVPVRGRWRRRASMVPASGPSSGASRCR